MKQTFLFIALLTICGSLTHKPAIVPVCNKTLVMKVYKNRKLVDKMLLHQGYFWVNHLNVSGNGGDSIVVYHISNEPSAKSKRKP
jgi:hypothetical protein